VAVVQVWRVFPYHFSTYALDWALLVRWALLVVIVGSVIGLIVSVIALLQISFKPR
jgi:hypothetical protein